MSSFIVTEIYSTETELICSEALFYPARTFDSQCSIYRYATIYVRYLQHWKRAEPTAGKIHVV